MPDESKDKRPLTDLDALFPTGVRTAMSRSPDAAGHLAPEETTIARAFSPVRLAEFRHGRSCARDALARLGATRAAIPTGSNREPIWPDGIIGSITHAGKTAAAAVCRSTQLASLGLDLEPAVELDPDLWRRVCRADELDRLRTSGNAPGVEARLVFSAKEAAYKALWPLTRNFLELHDLEIRFDMDAASFTVISHTDLCSPGLTARMDGRFMEITGLIATGVVLRAPGSA